MSQILTAPAVAPHALHALWLCSYKSTRADLLLAGLALRLLVVRAMEQGAPGGRDERRRAREAAARALLGSTIVISARRGMPAICIWTGRWTAEYVRAYKLLESYD